LSVKIIPAVKTGEETADEKRDRDDKAANDKAAIELTRDIARFNRYLVIVGIAQAAIFVLQLVVFGYQAGKLRQTIELTERTERPYVFLGMINGYVFPDAIAQRLLSRGPAATKNDEIPCAKFTITNNGRSPAVIKEISTALVAIDKDLPDTPDYNGCWVRPGEIILGAGVSSPTNTHLNDEPSFQNYAKDFEEVKRLYTQDTYWLFYGRIRYEDALGVEYVTGFGLRAMNNAVPNPFYAVGGKKWNYRQ